MNTTGLITTGMAAPFTADSDRWVAECAGYRVVRRLGIGSRSDIYLGYPTTTDGPPTALKVFRPEADRESIEREVRALTSASEIGLVQLMDVATLADGRVCVVLEKLEPRSLGRMLAANITLTPGETVSLLAPVIASLAGLHRAGLGHGSLAPGSILFHETGRPVLCGLGSLHDLPTNTAARVGALREDYARLAALLRTVFTHLDRASDPSGFASAADSLVERFDSARRSTPFCPLLTDLECSLFHWSAAAPLGFIRGEESPGRPDVRSGANGGRGRHRHTGTADEEEPNRREPEQPDPPARSVPSTEHTAPQIHSTGMTRFPGDDWTVATRSPEPPRGVLPNPWGTDALTDDAQSHHERASANPAPAGRGQAAHLAHRLARLLHAAAQSQNVSPFARMCEAVRERLRSRRRVLLMAALIACAAVIIALTTLPANGNARGVANSSAGTNTAASAPAEPAAAVPSSAPSADLAIRGTDRDVIVGDDPVAAVTVLLEARAVCLADADVECLSHIDQPGSAAMTADTDQMQPRQPDSAVPGTATATGTATGAMTIDLSPVLVERTGNIALVQLEPVTNTGYSEPASVLVIKGEAGWRIREILSLSAGAEEVP